MAEQVVVGERAPVLRVPASLGSLGAISAFVLALAGQGGLAEPARYRLRLAVDELATNAVIHGYRGRPGDLAVSGEVTADLVRVRLSDQAPPFDPRSRWRRPDPGLPAHARPIGGLGIHLALTSADEFEYARLDDRNVCTLAVRR
ncbi:ATP-binding protein [Streptacidiphilus rugosus]|uniref:ATP-binding protein n=1 Tax=Streptacidiphilus rugosus TaxID=405783 RepID=UPI0007C7B31C|nr:ATP-binding protein [Streptacidiphilus rugosus]